jgi:hypothetical protein
LVGGWENKMKKCPEGLTLKEKKKLIRIAWKQVEGFIRDWQKSPHEWYNERDIQVEIAGRIKKIYKRHHWDKIWGKYTKYVAKRYSGKVQFYSRVGCEPPVYHRLKNGKWEAYKPDIVIWGDIENPDHPFEGQYEEKKNDQMLWVCEIKYMPAWRKPHNPKNEDNRDIQKLKHLLNQDDGTKYACWLNIAYRIDQPCKNKFDNKPHIEGRLRKYYVTLCNVPH